MVTIPLTRAEHTSFKSLTTPSHLEHYRGCKWTLSTIPKRAASREQASGLLLTELLKALQGSHMRTGIKIESYNSPRYLCLIDFVLGVDNFTAQLNEQKNADFEENSGLSAIGALCAKAIL